MKGMEEIDVDYPEDVIAVGAKGKKEARMLRSKGADFVVYGYLDVESGKMLGKYSVLLKNERGEIEQFIIVPTAGGRELVVKHTTEKKPARRGIYDERNQTTVYF